MWLGLRAERLRIADITREGVGSTTTLPMARPPAKAGPTDPRLGATPAVLGYRGGCAGFRSSGGEVLLPTAHRSANDLGTQSGMGNPGSTTDHTPARTHMEVWDP